MSKHRLELFSDAVMAIILTIMVLDLRAPLQGGWHAWLAVLPSMADYLLGFLAVASIWVVHRQYFDRFRVINAQIIWANFTLLFVMSLLPLLVRAVADHPHDTADTLAFLINFDCIVLCPTWMRYAARTDHKHDPEFEKWFKDRAKHAYVTFAAVGLQGVVAFFFPVTALVLLGAMILLIAWGSINRTERAHYAASATSESRDDAALSL
jgi:uncharacterized membrane protein